MNTEKATTKKSKFAIFSVISRFFKPKNWVVKRCGFPYEDGYATWNKKTHTILDTGLTREQAEQICRELNAL
jgi:hypothetical protein